LAKYFHKRWYWQNIQPKAVILEDARPKQRIDIRNFFVNPNTYELQKIVEAYKRLPESKRIQKLKEWIRKNIEAKPEPAEAWKFPYETLRDRKGDCEDLAILLANLLVAAGVKPWKVRLCCGITKAGPHSWVEYFDGRGW